MLISVGALTAVMSLVASARNRSLSGISAHLLRAPRASTAHVKGGVPACVIGRVVRAELESRALVAPCSGELAVWVRVRARKLLGATGGGEGDGGTLWATLAEREVGVPFDIDDGSGARACISVEHAMVLAESRTYDQATPEMIGRLRSFFGDQDSQWMVASFFEEERIASGCTIAVLGVGQRTSSMAATRGYRGEPIGQLAFRAEDKQELAIATIARLRSARLAAVGGRVATSIGILILLAGLGLRLCGLLTASL